MPRNLKNRGFLGSWAVGSDTFCSIFREQSKAGTRVRLGAIVQRQSRLEPIVTVTGRTTLWFRCHSDNVLFYSSGAARPAAVDGDWLFQTAVANRYQRHECKVKETTNKQKRLACFFFY